MKDTDSELAFVHFDALYGFVVNPSSALFDEFITLDAKIEYFSTLNRELNKLFHDLVNDVCCSLKRNLRLFSVHLNDLTMRSVPYILSYLPQLMASATAQALQWLGFQSQTLVSFSLKGLAVNARCS